MKRAEGNSSDRALNCYVDAHKMSIQLILAPASLAKLHRNAILTSREGLSELLQPKNNKHEDVKKKYLTPAFVCSKIHKVGVIRRRIAIFVKVNRTGAQMDKIYEQTMLFDFYGELLTEHQRRIYEDVVYNDMSLGEIAEEQGISRQGVHDLVKRCDRILQGYEDKLHLVERFARAKEMVSRIEQLTMESEEDSVQVRENLARIRRLSQELLKEL